MPTFCAFPPTTLAHFLNVVFFFNMIWPFLWHINLFNVRQELVGQKRHNDSHKDRQQCAKQQVDHPLTLRVKKPLSRDKNSALQYVQYGRRLYRLYVSRLRCSSDLPNDCRKSSNMYRYHSCYSLPKFNFPIFPPKFIFCLNLIFVVNLQV